jgi:hypothetical protein
MLMPHGINNGGKDAIDVLQRSIPNLEYAYMTEMTPEKLKELSALMAGAPPETAARLLAMFERMKVKGSEIIPSNDLIAAMRDAGMTVSAGQSSGSVRLPSFDRLFFEPFESLFENGAMYHLLPGGLPRIGLKEVWLLVAGHIATDDMVELEPHATAAILRGDMERARELACQLRICVRKNLSGFSNEAIAKLAKTPESKAILLRLAPLLEAEACGRDIWASEINAKGEISDQGLSALCAIIRHLEGEQSLAALELLLLTMSILSRSCGALRMLNKISANSDDVRLDAGGFASVGRRILAMAKRAADMIDVAATSGIFNGQDLAATVERYNQSATGLEREVNLAPDGPWRREILATRKKASTHLELICQRATQNLEIALPVERTQKVGFLWTHEPRFHAIMEGAHLELAIQGLAFIAASRLFAPLAGFGAPREIAAKQAATYLDNVCEAVLHASRLPHKPANLQLWVQSTAKLIEALSGPKDARVFTQRANTSAAAA